MVKQSSDLPLKGPPHHTQWDWRLLAHGWHIPSLRKCSVLWITVVWSGRGLRSLLAQLIPLTSDKRRNWSQGGLRNLPHILKEERSQFSVLLYSTPALDSPQGMNLPEINELGYQFTNKGPSSQNYGFPSSHVWMWELDHKESWVLKNWCFWTVVLEKILESPLGCKEIHPVHPKGNQSWIFIGRTDAEAETPILWPPDAKNWLIGKDPDAGKHWRQ